MLFRSVSVFSPPGTFIPGKNITLGVGTIRGVESRGMLCSAAELQISEDHDGIMELPADAPIGAAYAQWYASNGAIGIKPTDAGLLKGFEMFRAAVGQPQEKRNETAKEIWKLLVDEVWSIGLVGQSPAYMGTRVVNERLENVPARTCVSQHCRTPRSGHPEQWYYR